MAAAIACKLGWADAGALPELFVCLFDCPLGVDSVCCVVDTDGAGTFVEVGAFDAPISPEVLTEGFAEGAPDELPELEGPDGP